jgi:DNA-binding protein HU-beta
VSDDEWTIPNDPAPARPVGRQGALAKSDLVAKVAADSGQSQAVVDGILSAFFATLAETVANDGKVVIPGWLGVERTETPARTGRNPQTGEEITIAASHRVKLTPGSKLKAAVKK